VAEPGKKVRVGH